MGARRFKNIWEAIEDDPVKVRNLKLRSELLIRISEKIRQERLTQMQAAAILEVSQPRVCALLQGKIEQFRLDSLVDMAHRLGLRVSIGIAA